jgi:catalase
MFRPSLDARQLTRAPHAHGESTPVTVRFSDSAGFPTVADNDPNFASPRGIAIRFHLGEHVHTDIIGHSTDGFPVRTPQEFLEFLKAAATSGPDVPSPKPIELFLGKHPSALKYVQTPKPIPTSFAKESFFSVNALKFIDAEGKSRFGRYRIRPELVSEYLDPAAAVNKSANFLFDDLAERISERPIKFEVVVQLAEAGDTVDDATVNWPESRDLILLGQLELTALVPVSDGEKRRIIFDPIPRVDGIEPSGDPLLETRADVYLASGRRRRAAAKAAEA